MNHPLLQVEGIHKRFGGVVALQDVSLTARSGEVLALIGENGAGKSTLVKILTGNHQPDDGSLRVNGVTHRFESPQAAGAAGIAAIHQEPSMFDELSVAENIFVSQQPRSSRLGLISWRDTVAQARERLDAIGVTLDPRARVGELSVAERHLVSLARALSGDSRLIIFDEPTAALSQSEILHLYRIIEELKAQGRAIIFISHKFDEIFRIADRYTVLRDGQFAGEGALADVDENALIAQMVGRTLDSVYPKTAAAVGDALLEVQGLSHPSEFSDIHFSVRRGEILGFYGLVGAGRTELMEALFGLKHVSAGTVRIDGKLLSLASPAAAMAAGIAYVPEDRQTHGAILPFSITANLSLPVLSRLALGLFLSRQREEQLAEDYGHRVQIKASGWGQPVGELSGGNQQKVVVGKWLATEPRIIILDEPTKGVDVGSKSAVHERIGALVQQGLSVILVSSELEEVLGIADRLMVMHRGQVVSELARNEFDAGRVVAAASGLNGAQA